MWQKLLAWNRNSATHLWANIVIWSSTIVEIYAQYADVISNVGADLLSDPTIKAQILGAAPPAWVPLLTFFIGLVVKAARNRTLTK